MQINYFFIATSIAQNFYSYLLQQPSYFYEKINMFSSYTLWRIFEFVAIQSVILQDPDHEYWLFIQYCHNLFRGHPLDDALKILKSNNTGYINKRKERIHKNTRMHVVHGRFLFLIFAFYIPILLFCNGLGYRRSANRLHYFRSQLQRRKPPSRYFRSLKPNIVLFFFSFSPLSRRLSSSNTHVISDSYDKSHITQLS